MSLMARCDQRVVHRQGPAASSALLEAHWKGIEPCGIITIVNVSEHA